VERQGIEKDEANRYLHVGFVGVANGSGTGLQIQRFQEPGTPAQDFTSTAAGSASPYNYWMAAVDSPQGENFNGQYLGAKTPRVEAFQANYAGRPQALAAGGTASDTPAVRGAQGVDILAAHQDSQKIANFDMLAGAGLVPHPAFLGVDHPRLLASSELPSGHDRRRQGSPSSRGQDVVRP